MAAYVVDHNHPLDDSVRESLANFAWGGDDITARPDNLQVFDALHAAEAQARGLTNWEYQQILYMQERIANSGIKVDSLVKQRDQLLSMLDLKDEETSTQRGTKIAGLSAVSFDCWVLNEIDPLQAKALQDRVTHKYGKQLYVATVARHPVSAEERVDPDVAIMADNLTKKVYESVRLEKIDFLRTLSANNQAQLGKRLTELDMGMVGEGFIQMFQETKRAVTETVSRIKSGGSAR